MTFIYKSTLFLIILLILSQCLSSYAQDNERLDKLDKTLSDLSFLTPGLNEKAQLSVSNVSIQEFLRGLAETHNLNISVNPDISIRVANNFNGEVVKNILIFLCKEYNLDIRFTGTIMSFYQFTPAPKAEVIPPPKEINIFYTSNDNLLTLDLKNDTLERVAKKITSLSKKNIVLSPGISNKIVNGYIENMPFDAAIDKFSFANQLKSIKTKDNFYLLVPENNDVNTKTGGSGSASKGHTSEELNLEINEVDGKKFITVDAINQSISDLIKKAAKELKINYLMFSEIKGNTTIIIQKVPFEKFLQHLLNGTEYTYKKQDSLYLIGDRNLEGLRTFKVLHLQFRSAKIIIDNIPAELKKGIEIKLFEELNSVIISGSAPAINEIVNFVDQIDHVVPMVSIEVIILDLIKNRAITTGINAGIGKDSTTQGSVLPSINLSLGSQSINSILSLIENVSTINLGRVNANFYMSLQALEKRTNSEIRSTPRLATLNGHEANLKIGRARYYEIRTQNVLGSLQPQTVVTQQFNQVQANLTVRILPIVSGDDQVTLEIDIDNTDFTNDSPPNAPPATATSSFKSIIRVKNEEMIVLGGLEKSENSETGSGIPFLARIPILKWFFSSKTKTKNRTKTLYFIRPTIMR